MRAPELPAAATPDPEPAAAADEPAPPPGLQTRDPAESADCSDLARADDELAPQHLPSSPPADQASPAAPQSWELPQWRYRTRRARKSQRQHRE